MHIRFSRDAVDHRGDRVSDVYRRGRSYRLDDDLAARLIARGVGVAADDTSPYWSVPRLWPGETTVCIGGGPSLTEADVSFCRGKARVIAINDAYRLAPWADLLYFCDDRWHARHRDSIAGFCGLKVKLEPAVDDRSVKILRNGDGDGQDGLDDRPNSLKTGRNSGYQAINLAVHLGAARIVLLGYDMKPAADGRSHWFGDHPWPTSPAVFARTMVPRFATLIEPLKTRAVSVVNATPDSALTCFQVQSLADSLLPGS